ncbi:hypothetical protein PF005_g1792 [Phytophthora fragariae]|uniref:Uncharacterized protein n=1 Tax=Phytophthora fragariae TaxID=53985 RepID=A0A6A3UPD1_9STRA|nr:hypothetical protein PF003_g15503 [Phytophthora fragariae]KAE8948620.1 hypothetical protein PF009_g1837 [Phytophthora fragariae]KAE9137048.1 hypothetical protein PF010_g1471 [Phytophthora fragariae]KAE9137176.1 hypothetical protein PF007_g1902 [Phytophthora fragariae]KAE9153105.1 hypothetical protein PF006_g2760 [Phytophthora fragariae]
MAPPRVRTVSNGNVRVQLRGFRKSASGYEDLRRSSRCGSTRRRAWPDSSSTQTAHYMCDGTAGVTIRSADWQPDGDRAEVLRLNLGLDSYTSSTPFTKMTVELLCPVIKSVLTSPPLGSDQADLVYLFKNNPMLRLV